MLRVFGSLSLLFMGALLLVAPLATRAQAPAQPAAKPAVSTELPLIDLARYKQLIGRYKGKALLVTFWATWCEPCREEYPSIVKLAAKYEPRGLSVIGVDMDDDADMNLVRHFLTQNQPMFPNYRQKPGIDVDEFYQGANPDWHGTMPETIFYGRDGQIALSFVGEKTPGDFERAIQTILAKPRAALPRAKTYRAQAGPAVPLAGN
jgi:thiol-disulfide isomerase/thioredoxin